MYPEKNLPMKTISRLILLFLFVCNPLSLSAAEDATSQQAIPDLLDEEARLDAAAETKQEVQVYDPLESMNRVFFDVNDRLYTYVMKPVSTGYSWIIPHELRECIGNFFGNLRFPVNFLNSALQGDLNTMGIVVERFLINSTIGVYGLVDVAASEFDIAERRADFGQTLGRWGIGEGVFIFWPILGPSNLRDTAGLATDTFMNPLPYVYDDRAIDVALYSTDKVNNLSLNPDLYEDLKRYSLDPYVAARQLYIEHRRSILVRN